jgi:hypothetical protein
MFRHQESGGVPRLAGRELVKLAGICSPSDRNSRHFYFLCICRFAVYKYPCRGRLLYDVQTNVNGGRKPLKSGGWKLHTFEGVTLSLT